MARKRVGSLTVDLWVEGKRVRFRTGATDRRTAEDYKTMVRALHIRGRLDLLEGLLEGRYSAQELMTAFRLNEFERLPRAEDVGPLRPRWEAWAAGAKREKAAYAWAYLATCTVLRDLPPAVRAMREALADRPRAFGLYRNEVLCFLRDTVSKAHPVYREVAAIARLPLKPRERGRPWSVAEVRDLCAALDPATATVVQALCKTGAGVAEYWRDGIEVLEDRVLIHGQKRASRDRVVPLWAELQERPTLTVAQMRTRLEGTGFGLYDGRRTFARWCEEAGIVRSHLEAYMGHRGNMTSLYTRGELPGQLAEDARKLADYYRREAGR